MVDVEYVSESAMGCLKLKTRGLAINIVIEEVGDAVLDELATSKGVEAIKRKKHSRIQKNWVGVGRSLSETPISKRDVQ